MPVKRALLLAALFVATPVSAEISEEVKATCMDAKDFVGCVQALSGKVPNESSDDLQSLRDAMRQVSARIGFGSSLRDSTLFYQPVIDAYALAVVNNPDALPVKAAAKATQLFDLVQIAWQARINNKRSYDEFGILYPLKITRDAVKAFNKSVGSDVVEYKQHGNFFGQTSRKTGYVNEGKMMEFIQGILLEGSVDPSVVDKYESERESQIRRANTEAWEEHLSKNPSLKAWAAANPSMAAKARVDFNAKNPRKPVSMPAYVDTLKYLSRLNPPL